MPFLEKLPNGAFVKVAGLVLVRQRPETAKGVCFMTIQDETGVANLVIFPALFNQYRKEVMQSKLIMVAGKVQRDGDVIHVIAGSCHNFSKLLRVLTPAAGEGNLPLLPFDEVQNKGVQVKENTNEEVMPKGRSFK